jgi:hypothetical protein
VPFCALETAVGGSADKQLLDGSTRWFTDARLQAPPEKRNNQEQITSY